MKIWYKRVLKVHLNNFGGYAGLLLDDFVCSKSNNSKNSLQSGNCLLRLVPPNYTLLLRPCDVGLYKELKGRLKN